jgi:effector-binding domain-containing protein
MLDQPRIVQTDRLSAAVIRLTIPKNEIGRVMGPAMMEVMAAVSAQGLASAGPMFSHHFRIDPAVWDFEVGVPVAGAVSPVGRVKPGELPARRVVRAVYQGTYEGLGPAWGELIDWITAEGLEPAQDFWECYLAGPENNPDPAGFRTELNRPLAG